ncbi:hypothetical protein RvY_15514 [Ramazzottius varieornatus]|uniref:Uncharacterized protein n=1 Tax=Ramazzottius varieornatus TaxID=947166 RepID=A0A1D1VV60_RAMVA|nr:hypothetical protein RvY_15514 [Ramazzottius varieornatus]
MPLRNGPVLKLPRESSTTVPSKNKKEPKKKKQGTTSVEPASAVSPVRSPSPPIVLPHLRLFCLFPLLLLKLSPEKRTSHLRLLQSGSSVSTRK